ncbi:MAG: mechanosensitive ion channel family protein [Marinicellaceae bacterium]
MEQENLSIIDTLKQNIMSFVNNPDAILAIVTKVVIAFFIYWIGKKIAKLLSHLVGKALTRSGAAPILINFLKTFIYFLLLTVVIITALGELGIQTTSLLGIIAAAGLAIGLALKDSLSNIASGVMIVFFRPFKIGDFIEVAGHSGTVLEIRIFNTLMKSTDNKQIIIPNGEITTGSIINYSANATRRVDLVVGVSYDDDLKLAKKIMLDILESHELVLKDPAPSVNVIALADSSVNFNVRPWVKTDDYWKVYSDVLEQIKVGLEAGGCNLPYPQRDVHLHQANS